ncbi:Sodium Bile acid symporter family protein [Aquimixticola soesokkakensis]|uniref:Sodium Bile acid symporter family protein n=1 Tax=Aquimixticola soesokkakensis TaxID=1519096 RepID=A0A1Y5TEU3_9RHOB|nr:bile acid:sodium symporter family protein [Aquimixticola soesokkakensis]SLN62628.1 Sodium Bile acid symporter family protein [Aquimixticola soesokkakensis]
MRALKRFGIDTYMILLLATVVAGAVLPAQGEAASLLRQVTFWAVALLFLIYGAKLDPASVRAGFLNWKLQSLTFGATFVLFPLLGLCVVTLFGRWLGPDMITGVLFLSILPSTVQSSIAFTSMAGGNVPAAICSASVSNIIGVALTPLLASIVLHQNGTGISLGSIGKIGQQIILPFIIGQVLRPYIGAFIARHKRLTMVVDRGSILLIVYAAFSAGTVAGLWTQVPPQQLVVLILIVEVFLGLAFGVMLLAGPLLGLVQADRIVLLFCGSTKSLASGLPIATALFAPDILGAIVLPTMIFHLSQLLLSSALAQRLAPEA